MRKNELYVITSPLFPAPARNQSRLVIVRDFDQNNVTFSVCSDEQRALVYGLIDFYPSAFTVGRPFFEEFFVLVGEAHPATVGGVS